MLFSLTNEKKLKNGRRKYNVRFINDFNYVDDFVYEILNNVSLKGNKGTIQIDDKKFTYQSGKLSEALGWELSRRSIMAAIVEGDAEKHEWNWKIGTGRH